LTLVWVFRGFIFNVRYNQRFSFRGLRFIFNVRYNQRFFWVEEASSEACLLPAEALPIEEKRAMIKTTCRTVTTNRAGMDEASSGKKSYDADSDVHLPLVIGEEGEGEVVTYLGEDKNSVPAEPVIDLASCNKDWPTSALPAPVRMEIAIPTGNWDAGQPIVAHGPGGAIRVHLPPDAEPGTTLMCKIAPSPEYRIRVPLGAKPGSLIRFRKQDGEEVAVGVPPGVQRGETFDVVPPALIVRVPDQAKPGDYVMFSQVSGARKDGKGGRRRFFRSRVPNGCQPLDHFCALLPPPPQGSARAE